MALQGATTAWVSFPTLCSCLVHQTRLSIWSTWIRHIHTSNTPPMPYPWSQIPVWYSQPSALWSFPAPPALILTNYPLLWASSLPQSTAFPHAYHHQTTQSLSLYLNYLNLSYSSLHNCICSFSPLGMSSSSFALQALCQMFYSRYYSVFHLLPYSASSRKSYLLPLPSPYTSVLNLSYPLTVISCLLVCSLLRVKFVSCSYCVLII